MNSTNDDNLLDVRGVRIEFDDKVLLTNNDSIRVGTVIGFLGPAENRYSRVRSRVVVETAENVKPVLIQSHKLVGVVEIVFGNEVLWYVLEDTL